MATVTRYKIYPASSIPGHGPTCGEKGSIQYGELDGKTGRTVFGVRWIGAVPRASTDGFTNFSSTVGEHNLIPNLISKLPHDIVKMIYHLVLKEERGVLLLRFKDHTLSTAYTLGPVSRMPNGTTRATLTWRECWRTRNIGMENRARASTWMECSMRSTISGMWDTT